MKLNEGEPAEIVLNLDDAVWHDVNQPLKSLIHNFLTKTFPVTTCIHLTEKQQRISTPSTLTKPIKKALLASCPGACMSKTYPVPGSKFGLQPDYEIPLQSFRIAVESQFGLRESVFYDILKQTELQRTREFDALVELIPSDRVSRHIAASAGISRLRIMLQTIVLPYLKPCAVKFLVVPIDLRP